MESRELWNLDTSELEREFLERLVRHAEEESARPSGLYFSVDRDDVVLTISNEALSDEIADFLADGIAAIVTPGISTKLIAVVKALLGVRALVAKVELIEGEQLRVLQLFFGRSPEADAIDAGAVSVELGIPVGRVEEHLEDLEVIGSLESEGGRYNLKDRFRVRIPRLKWEQLRLPEK